MVSTNIFYFLGRFWVTVALHEKCPHSELPLSVFSRSQSEYGKIRTRIIPNTDTFCTVEYSILTFLLKVKLGESLEKFLKIWIILTLNLYDVVSTSVSVWLGSNIRYFTSQIVVDLLHVKEAITINIHIPWQKKTFQLFQLTWSISKNMSVKSIVEFTT